MTKPLPELVQALSPDMQAEVRNFIAILLTRQEQKVDKKLKQNWAGALRDYRQQYTSLELQHQALEFRGD